MKKMILLIFLLAAARINVVNAQPPISTQIAQARIEMLKATAEFLTKDTSVFKSIKDTECTCKSWEDVEAFVGYNDLLGVRAIMKAINSKPADTSHGKWKDDLTAFKTKLIDSFFSKSSRVYRKQMEGYNAYEKNMQSLIDKIDPPPAVKIVPVPAPNPNREPERVKPTRDNTLYIITFTVIPLLLVIAYFLFRSRDKLKRQYKLAIANGEALRIELMHLRQTLENERSRNARLEDELKLALQEKENTERLLSKKTQEPPGSPEPEIPTRQIEQPQKKYAKYADAGDGFSDLYLLDKPNNETIFEITVTSPEIATYIVSTDANVQKYALSNTDYFLRKTCQYDTFPSVNSAIHTLEPGQLRKEGNKWSILTAAKISFN